MILVPGALWPCANPANLFECGPLPLSRVDSGITIDCEYCNPGVGGTNADRASRSKAPVSNNPVTVDEPGIAVVQQEQQVFPAMQPAVVQPQDPFEPAPRSMLARWWPEQQEQQVPPSQLPAMQPPVAQPQASSSAASAPTAAGNAPQTLQPHQQPQGPPGFLILQTGQIIPKRWQLQNNLYNTYEDRYNKALVRQDSKGLRGPLAFETRPDFIRRQTAVEQERQQEGLPSWQPRNVGQEYDTWLRHPDNVWYLPNTQEAKDAKKIYHHKGTETQRWLIAQVDTPVEDITEWDTIHGGQTMPRYFNYPTNQVRHDIQPARYRRALDFQNNRFHHGPLTYESLKDFLARQKDINRQPVDLKAWKRQYSRWAADPNIDLFMPADNRRRGPEP